MIFLIKGELMIKEMYTQLCLHDQMSGVNTIVFTPSLSVRWRSAIEMREKNIDELISHLAKIKLERE